jgi:hypothetical protein
MATRDRRFFLVERYVPSISSAAVGSAIHRLVESGPPTAVHVYSVLVADEETCLSVFEASDVESVEAANEQAGFPVDRIVEVEVFPRPTSRSEDK